MPNKTENINNLISLIDELYETADCISENNDLEQQQSINHSIHIDQVKFLLSQSYLEVCIPSEGVLQVSYIRNEIDPEIKSLFLCQLLELTLNINEFFSTPEESKNIQSYFLHDGIKITHLDEDFIELLNIQDNIYTLN